MKKTDKILRTVMFCGLATTGLTLVGCSTDDNIDVSDVDTTIGVKLDKFTVPLGKTDDISIDDVLELKDGDCIKIKDNGDYVFEKIGDDVKGADDINVDPVKFANPQSQNYVFTFKPSDYVAAARSQFGQITATGDITVPQQTINAFSFSNASTIAEVKSLTHAVASSEVKLNLDVTSLSALASKITLKLQFPDFLELQLKSTGLPAGTGFDATGKILTIPNIPTNTALNVTLDLVGIKNFKTTKPATGDYVVVNPDEISMSGKVLMDMFIAGTDVTAGIAPLANTYNMNAGVTFDNSITLSEATGYFTPSISLDDMGDINIGDDVPDFLKDDENTGEKNVDLKLSNPCITLSVDNNIDATGIINATMTAFYKDKSKKTISLNGLTVDPHKGAITSNTKTTFFICRKNENAPAGAKVVVKDGTDNDTDIADLLSEIPDKITFTCSAAADGTYKGTIKLGQHYKIKPAYSFSAPLSLDPGSKIVYDDKVDDFYKDIEDNDIDFREEANLEITGKVTNKTPLELVLESTAVDLNGNPITGITLTNSNTIKSNLDGSAPTNLVIKMTKAKGVNLKDVKFNGITFKAKATSASAETLNKDKHTIKIEDLKISISGEVSIDTDSKK